MVFDMKGQQDVLSAILISGILIAVVVYLWGVPLVEKNRDISILQNSEEFMRLLDEKIKFISNHGGRDTIEINVPGLVEFSPSEQKIYLTLETQGTIYAAEIESPLGKNECTMAQGLWGQDDSSTLCVKSNKIEENKFRTIFSLGYIELKDKNGIESYKIELSGKSAIGGEAHNIIIENKGVEKSDSLTKTLISITID